MPFKANSDRRHHIPKQRHRVTNWSDYDAALRQRWSLTVWFTETAISAWQAEPRITPGGQPLYSALAITTALTLRAVFRLALRQTEGLIGSILQLLGLDLDRDGQVRWLRCEGVPRTDDAGTFLGYTGCNVDFTEACLVSEELEGLVAERTAELMAAEETLRQS